MRTEPTDLSPVDVIRTLTNHWAIETVALTYIPLGFGSHHWRADDKTGTSWFLTVDDHRGGRFGVPENESAVALGRAMGTAAALRAAGLASVIAPVPDGEGSLVVPVGGTLYTVTVFPFLLAGAIGHWGTFPTEAGRRAALGLIAQVHRASDSVPVGLPRTETFVIPHRDGLLAALGKLDEP